MSPTTQGLTTFYADESDDKSVYVIACVAVPTLVHKSGAVENRWSDYYQKVRDWRQMLKAQHNIPVAKELKGSKLATGRNRYDGGANSIQNQAAYNAYSNALQSLSFLPDGSVFSVCAPRSYKLFGYTRLEAALYAMFQRMERQLTSKNRFGLIFFDEGHAEYRTLFRKACAYLPTGSRLGQWASGATTKNIPFAHAIKDANFKDSKQSHFIQIADLVAYATLLKAKKLAGALSPREATLGLGDIHDHIPRQILNTRVQTGGIDGIKWLK